MLIAKGVSAKPYMGPEYERRSTANSAIESGDYRILQEVCKAGAKLTDVGYIDKSGEIHAYGDSLAATAMFGKHLILEQIIGSLKGSINNEFVERVNNIESQLAMTPLGASVS